MTRRRLTKVLIAATLATGVSMLLYTAYLVWDPGAAERQHQLATQLENSWRKPLRHDQVTTAEPRLITGRPFAFIQIPRFGPHWRFTIVEGKVLSVRDSRGIFLRRKRSSRQPPHSPSTTN